MRGAFTGRLFWSRRTRRIVPSPASELVSLAGVRRQSDHNVAALRWEATRCPSGTSGTSHIEKSKGYHAMGLVVVVFLRTFDEFLVCSLQLFSKVVGITSWI